jgi:hypothetical protein
MSYVANGPLSRCSVVAGGAEGESPPLSSSEDIVPIQTGANSFVSHDAVLCEDSSVAISRRSRPSHHSFVMPEGIRRRYR